MQTKPHSPPQPPQPLPRAPGQLSLPELELLPTPPARATQPANTAPPPRQQRVRLQGAALEVAMRQVFKGWVRWHRCKCYELAVADPVTRRLLELTANRGP